MRETIPLKRAGRINRRVLPEETDPDWAFRYVDISQVDGSGRVSLPTEVVTFGAAPSRARRLAPAGATLISTVRTYLRAIAHVTPADGPVVYSTGFAVVEPVEGVDGRFLTYACQSRRFVDEVVARSVGVSYPAINPSELGSIAIPYPALEEQRRIADFLDDQVARIDAVIAARARGIELLREEFDSEWDARTFALQGADVQLRRVLASIVDGPFGSSLTSAHYSEKGTRVVRLGNIGIAEFRGADEAYISAEYAATLGQHAVAPGDLIMAGLGDDRWPLGRACVAPDDLGPAIVKADCYRIRLTDSMSSTFAAWFLSAPASRQRFLELSRGATRARLNTDVVRAVQVTLPSKSDQEDFALAMQTDRAVLAEREDSLAASSRLLQEYKQSLITAAVSGDVDVTTASGISVP